MTVDHTIPIIDLSAYLAGNANVSTDHRYRPIEQITEACKRYGFFQIKGHGVPLQLQREVLEASKTLFALPQVEKDALSLKNNVARRGYESLGEQTLDKDALPDRKEGFYLGVEHSSPSFFRGPNQWPKLPTASFKDPITAYHKHMLRLADTVVQILAHGLGLSKDLDITSDLRADPVCNLKLLHYPPSPAQPSDSNPRAEAKKQFGAGAHTDFGILTLLLQQPGTSGLQVYTPSNSPPAGTNSWQPVPALADVLVVNVGDLLGKWTDGVYKSALHRVVHDGEGDRYSVPCFWQGTLEATNPFREGAGEGGQTVEQHVRRRFEGSYGE